MKPPFTFIRHSFLSIVVSILFLSCEKSENSGFTVHGIVKGNLGTTIYLKVNNTIDSVAVKNNTFTFQGRVEYPVEANLYPSSPSSKKFMGSASFMIENSEMLITVKYEEDSFNGKLTKFLKLDSISGSKSHQSMVDFGEKMKNTFYKEDNDSVKQGVLYENLFEFISSNPTSVLNGEKLAFYSEFFQYLNSSQIQNLYDLIDTTYQNKRDLKSIQNIIKRRAVLSVGKIFPEISLPNQNGELISSKIGKGKFLLLEFWASWCVPCRQNNPALKKVYNTYKDKNFEILGVSVDNNSTKWKEAIQKDQLNWIQVLDNEKVMAKKILLNGVPYNILLNKHGEIIKRNIKTSELNEFLAAN